MLGNPSGNTCRSLTDYGHRKDVYDYNVIMVQNTLHNTCRLVMYGIASIASYEATFLNE